MSLKSSLLLLVIFSLSSPALAQHEAHQHAMQEGDFGKVEFPTSCAPQAREPFARALAVLHSFWYEEAGRRFTAITEQHPDCAMAYWGIAMSLYHPLWAPPTAEELDRGWAAVKKARSIEGVTERERGYIKAIAHIFEDADRLDHRTRALAFTESMGELSRKYADDPEASMFYALGLVGTALTTDKTYANQKKAGDILLPIFEKQPLHPGLAHYIIHAFDYPPLAERALDAARRYAKIAPSVPHALHMPSHIFIRLGLWQEAIDSNRASADAAIHYARQGFTTAYGEQLHALDYMMYARLQMGAEKKARDILQEAVGVRSPGGGAPMWSYAHASIPVRFTIERRRWADAMELEPQDYSLVFSQALLHWARAIGGARSGKPAQAMRDAEVVRQLRDQLAAQESPAFLNETEVLVRQAEGWYAFADGRQEEALELMRAAADLEDSFEKHPVTPGAVTPAREMLADLLLELQRPGEALREFEASLRSAPNRFNGIYGAARSAQGAGDRAKAQQYFAALVKLGGEAEPERAELREARAYLEKQKEQKATAERRAR